MRRRVAVGAGLLVGLLGMPALAEVPGLTLTWRAPEGCPTQAAVERAVLEGRLDRASAPGRQVQAAVNVVRQADGTFSAELTTVAPEGRGTRALQGESCDAIASASAVVLALALDPPSEPVAASPAPPPAPPPAPEPAPLVVYAHAFGGVVMRALPRPSSSFGLGVGVRRGQWDGQLLFSWSPSQEAQASAPPGAGAKLSLASAQALGCFAPVYASSTALEVCAGGLVERFAGTSHDISNPAEDSVVLVSPELGLRSRTRLLPRLHLALGVAGVARLKRPRFVIGGLGQVHETPSIDGLLEAGLELSF